RRKPTYTRIPTMNGTAAWQGTGSICTSPRLRRPKPGSAWHATGSVAIGKPRAWPVIGFDARWSILPSRHRAGDQRYDQGPSLPGDGRRHFGFGSFIVRFRSVGQN